MTRDGAAEPAKRALVQLGPDLRARSPRQQPHRFARVAERQDEEPRASVLARRGIAHHRALAVVDLAFFAGRGRDDDARLGGRRAAQLRDEAADARVARGEAVVVDEVLPDRHRVAAARQRLGDQLAIRLAGARARGAARRWRTHEVGGHLRGVIAGFAPRSVDTSAEMAGFAVDSLGRPRPRTGDAGGLQIAAGRLATDAGRLLDAPERPAQPPERQICCCLSLSKTLLIPAKDYTSLARVNVSAGVS